MSQGTRWQVGTLARGNKFRGQGDKGRGKDASAYLIQLYARTAT